MSVMQYLLWFMRLEHQEFEEGASNEWKKTCVVIGKVAERTREIVIHAYKWSECPTTDMPSVDVGRAFPTRGIPNTVSPQMVTGVDWCVLAYMITQCEVAKALREAVLEVESRDPPPGEMSFTCPGGTHRSLGLAVLTNAVVYPRALVAPHTPRTIEAAQKYLDTKWDG